MFKLNTTNEFFEIKMLKYHTRRAVYQGCQVCAFPTEKARFKLLPTGRFYSLT